MENFIPFYERKSTYTYTGESTRIYRIVHKLRAGAATARSQIAIFQKEAERANERASNGSREPKRSQASLTRCSLQ